MKNYSEYERLKSVWILRNSGASAEQYETAMRAIAARLGV